MCVLTYTTYQGVPPHPPERHILYLKILESSLVSCSMETPQAPICDKKILFKHHKTTQTRQRICNMITYIAGKWSKTKGSL